MLSERLFEYDAMCLLSWNHVTSVTRQLTFYDVKISTENFVIIVFMYLILYYISLQVLFSP